MTAALTNPRLVLAALLMMAAVPRLAAQPDLEILTPGEGYTFGEHDVDEGPVARLLRLRNTGDADLQLTTVTLTAGDLDAFAVLPTTYAATVPPGETRFFTVAFVPLEIGPHTATLLVGSDDPETPVVELPLSGAGVDQEIHVAPPLIHFDPRAVDDGPSSPALVTIYNRGTAPLRIAEAALTGANPEAFVFSALADEVIPPGLFLQRPLAFDPLTTGPASAALHILCDDTDESTVTIPLSGEGFLAEARILVSPESVTFGAQDVDPGPTPPRLVAVQNLGGGDLQILGLSVLGTHASRFAVVDSAVPFVVGPSGSRFVPLTFDPEVTGPASALLRIQSADPGRPVIDVPLFGVGVDQEIEVAPGTLFFPPHTPAAPPSQITVTIHNTGSFDLAVVGVELLPGASAAFSIAGDTAQTVLPPEATREVSIQFAPSDPGPAEATLRIRSDDTDEPVLLLPLSGLSVENTGVQAAWRRYR